MTQENPSPRFPFITETSERDDVDLFHREEVQLALRNRGMPLEAMRYPITPSGMHYLVIHFDIPDVDVGRWRLKVGGLVSKPLSLSLEDIKQRPTLKQLRSDLLLAGDGHVVGSNWLILGTTG